MGQKKKRGFRPFLPGGLFGAGLLFALLLAAVLFGLNNAGMALDAHGQRQAEEAVRRAAVSCYALEGAYPESYEYLKRHYGLKINEELYGVSYTIFASNLMPEISVVRRQAGV